MRYVVPNWEREFVRQPWPVQKWCLVKCEQDIKKATRQQNLALFMTLWCAGWSLFSIATFDGWWSVFCLGINIPCGFYWYHAYRTAQRKIEIVTAVNNRMKELINHDS